jgi:hypothetical protein
MSWEDHFDKMMEGLDKTMEGLDKTLEHTFTNMDKSMDKLDKRMNKLSGRIKVGKGTRIVIDGVDVTDQYRKKNTEEEYSNVIDAKDGFDMWRRRGSRLIVYTKFILAIITMLIFIAIGSAFYSAMTVESSKPKQFDTTPAPIEQPIQKGEEKRL